MANKRIYAVKIVVIPLIVIILLCGIIFSLSWIPKNIDVSYPAYVYSGDSSAAFVSEQTTIAMKGKLYRPLFLDARYDGTVDIGYYGSIQGTLMEIQFSKDWQGYGHVIWRYFDTSGALTITDFNYIGDMKITSNADKIFINGVLPQDIGKDSPTTNVYIAAPAETLEDALQLAFGR